jgi:uncharacterized membrane protein
MYGLELTLLFRLLHVAGGIFWVGGAFVSMWFIVPAVRASGPEGAKVMQEIVRTRKLPLAMNITGIITVLSGFWLYSRNIHLSAGTWAHSTSGMILGLGGAAALVALINGNLVLAPSGRKLAEVGRRVQGASGAPAAEDLALLNRLGNRMRWATWVNAVLLTIATVTMAIGRYI